MNELDKILAVTKGQAAAGTDRIAFDPMALAHAIETGVAAKLAEERERWRELAQDVSMIANGGHLPDGDGVNIPTLLWAEEWERRMYGPNVEVTGKPPCGAAGAR